MMRLARLPLAAALFLLVACHGDRAVTPDLGRPSALIVDGANSGGNPDFFFLPPMVPDPSGNSNFDKDLFNATLTPFVDVCQLTGDPREDDPNDQTDDVACDHLVFGPVAAPVSASHYQVNWHTDASNNGAGLDVAEFYRIQVYTSEGSSLLGFADLDPVSTGKELKNLRTGDVIGLIDGRTLPIRFRIEVGAACFDVDPCTQRVINLSEDNTIILEGTGDRLDIPPQNTNRVITVTLQLCDREDGIDVDLRKFGNCLTITSNPPLGAFRFSPAATVSMCSVLAGSTDPVAAAELAALGAQRELVTMHRQDDGDIFALPHGGPFCDEPSDPIGSGPSNLFRQLARSLGSLVTPRPLHAATTVLDVGPSGETDFFSDFQLALPAKMEALNETDACDVEGSIDEPAVCVTDARGAPVNGATVHFEVDPGEGAVFTVDVVTGSEEGPAGVAQLGGELSFVSVRAWGMGIADPITNGPQGDVFDPFWPDFSVAAVADMVVPVDIGEVVFTVIIDPPPGFLGFVEQPTDQIANLRTLNLVVLAQDAAGAVIPGVLVTLKDGPQNPALGCGLGGAQITALTDAAGRATFSLIDVSSACDAATLVATGSKAGLAPMTVESESFAIADLGGRGTPIIDGEFDEAWGGARCLAFAAGSPEGGTTPALLCAMNDETNIYFFVRFSREGDPKSSVDFQFDQNRSGTINSGDDLIIFRNPQFTFQDDHWFDSSVSELCPVGSICSRSDAAAGGTVNGQGAFGNNGGETVYEVAHPLQSGDNHDISVGPGQTMDFFLGLNIFASATELTPTRTSFRTGKLLKFLVQ